MESRLDADFSDVRLHTGAAAARSARAIGARAYTSGSHVVLGTGGADKHTLAHELTHVVQQRQGPVAGTDNGAGLRISDPSDHFEREAETNARRVMSGAAPTTREAGRSAAPAERTQRQAVQRWTDTAAQDANQTAMEVSAGGVFAVASDEPTSVWIRVGTAQNAFSPALRPTVTPTQDLFGTGAYQEYQLARNILDDCLHTAEEIMHNAVGELQDGQLNSSVRTTAGLKPFGTSDESNRERAGAFDGATDGHASPVVGQSYLMIAMNPGDAVMSQYHAAAVVGMDGTDGDHGGFRRQPPDNRGSQDVHDRHGSLVPRLLDGRLLHPGELSRYHHEDGGHRQARKGPTRAGGRGRSPPTPTWPDLVPLGLDRAPTVSAGHGPDRAAGLFEAVADEEAAGA